MFHEITKRDISSSFLFVIFQVASHILLVSWYVFEVMMKPKEGIVFMTVLKVLLIKKKKVYFIVEYKKKSFNV